MSKGIKTVSADEAIARLDAVIDKDEIPEAVEIVRGVLAGPPAPQGTPALTPPLDIESLDDPDANQLFQLYVVRYVEISGERPSSKVMNLLKFVAEIDFVMEGRIKSILAAREQNLPFSIDIKDKSDEGGA